MSDVAIIEGMTPSMSTYHCCNWHPKQAFDTVMTGIQTGSTIHLILVLWSAAGLGAMTNRSKCVSGTKTGKSAIQISHTSKVLCSTCITSLLTLQYFTVVLQLL